VASVSLIPFYRSNMAALCTFDVHEIAVPFSTDLLTSMIIRLLKLCHIC
jgi:hypothetical protein